MSTNKQYHKGLFVLWSMESPKKSGIMTVRNDIKHHKRNMYALSVTEQPATIASG